MRGNGDDMGVDPKSNNSYLLFDGPCTSKNQLPTALCLVCLVCLVYLVYLCSVNAKASWGMPAIYVILLLSAEGRYAKFDPF